MATVMTMHWPEITKAQYEQVRGDAKWETDVPDGAKFHVAWWGNDGKVSHADSMTCIRLLGQEVMPALREIGNTLGLKSPFEVHTPVSLAATAKGELAAAAAT